MEADVSDGDGDPGKELSDGNEVLEPSKDARRASGGRHVGEERDGGCEENAVVWDASDQKEITRQ